MSTRKDKIKNIAIIFLLLMLLLTFFSNTIMNYSLVEVSTQMVMSDTITTKVRGSGMVEASENYTVSIGESRKIATVNVKTGAEVTQGDVLFTLEDMESEELVAARNALDDAELAYETAVLGAGITVAERQAIEAGNTGSLSDKQNAISNAQINVTVAQQGVAEIQAQIKALENSKVDTSAEELAKFNAERAVTVARENQTAKQSAVTSAQADYTALEDKYGKNPTDPTQKADLEAAQKKIDAAVLELNKATNAVNSAERTLSEAEYNLAKKQLSGNTEAQAGQLAQQLEVANAALETAQTELEVVTNRTNAQLTLGGQYQNLKELRADVAELESKAVDAEVTAPISGTVTEILYTAGQTVAPEEGIMLIQPENKGFTLKFNVTANQAKRIKPGDQADILNNWWGNEIYAKVASIRKDPADKNSSIVTCEVTGDVSVGDYYTLSIGEQSANYDLVVPTSSIREDSNGNFILIIESKSTPLGNRYYARRVDVEVITSDDTKSAITGALESYGVYVITTTTKPVEENQQVRLAE